jgi:hypothetical protein
MTKYGREYTSLEIKKEVSAGGEDYDVILFARHLPKEKADRLHKEIDMLCDLIIPEREPEADKETSKAIS